VIKIEPTQRLALRRLDLDHVGTGLGHQQGRVRPLIGLVTGTGIERGRWAG
jgi:hypothetical protein